MATTTRYLWDETQDAYLSELDEMNTVKAVYTNEPQHYGGVISQRRGCSSSTLHADVLGSTRLVTDESEATSDEYTYDAWGNAVAKSSTAELPFTWVGKSGYYQDENTGLVYVRARMYAPTLARWIGPDRYIYAMDAALKFVDPSRNFALNASVPDLTFHSSDELILRGVPSAQRSVTNTQAAILENLPVLHARLTSAATTDSASIAIIGNRLIIVDDPKDRPILKPQPVSVWPSPDEFQDRGTPTCSCKSLRGNRMRPTSPATGQPPPEPGLPWAICADGEVVMVRYEATCEAAVDRPCKMPCEASICWEYVCYKCRNRRLSDKSKFPDITTEWSSCGKDDPRSKGGKVKCQL
ncbi:MAG: RHS repeat-associated core domain-containing protein [Planctomycetaceae bacterium]|nr:RHS repeat-associated core domain-containing protein [Planctomycetaceae bacterium]